MENLYVAGRMFHSADGHDRFNLMRPSNNSLPYYTRNSDSRTMRMLAENGSGLYEVDFKNKKFTNIHDSGYTLRCANDDEYQVIRPDEVVNMPLFDEVLKAMAVRKTCLA